jgi:flavoprotein
MTDELTDSTDATYSDTAPVPESVVIEEVVQPAGSLEQFTYSVRHRTARPFASGPYEGRIRLGTYEFIVSSTTLDDLITKMTVKADSLIANGYKTQG